MCEESPASRVSLQQDVFTCVAVKKKMCLLLSIQGRTVLSGLISWEVVGQK